MQSTVGQQLRIASPEAARQHPALITVDRLGVEEELEGINSADLERAKRHLAPLWTSHQDGSLRNGGVEFVTAGGLGGQDLFSAFERLTHLLANVIEYQDSFRCSTHMHIDMLDFTVPQVANFLLVYTACEPYLFEHCGQYRRSSNFCVPVGDSLPFHKTLISNLYEDCVQAKSAGRYTNKYTALNLQPLFGTDRVRPIGTVEFRGGRPMTTMDEFLLQANLLLSIKQFVRQGPADPEELLRSMGDTVTNSVYANGVAGNLHPQVSDLEDAMISAWMLLKAFQQGMKKPKRMAQEVPPSFDWNMNSVVAAPSGPPIATLSNSYWNDAITGIPPSIFSHGAEGEIPEPEESNLNPLRGIWNTYDQFHAELAASEPGSRRWSKLLVAIFKDRRLGDRGMFSENEALSLGITWQLRGIERSILPAVRRAMMSRVNRGKRQGLLRLSFDSQPTVVVPTFGGIGGFQWTTGLTPEYANRFREMYGYVNYGQERRPDVLSAFYAISERRVRTKNRNILQAALDELTGERTVIVNEFMFISEMYHLLRMTGLSSADHVFRSDLNMYDLVAETMQMLYACRQTVPVRCAPRTLWGTPPSGNGKLYLTNKNDDNLRMFVPDPEVAPWRERRVPRVTIDENVHIY